MSSVGVVIIGRNEGARLHRCIASLRGQVDRLVYVDSGSTDGSADWARAQGVEVVTLDTTAPFTAARGRNAGFDRLARDGLPDYVQFIDGDCAAEPGWIAAAAAFLDRWPTVGIVTGWRTEVAPDASLYNRLAEVEWHRPAGPIAACGGDMMVRSGLWAQLGGMDGGLICSEDEDLVIRARATGLTAHRIGQVMTRHDAAMTRFGQWWRRALRSGHGFAEVGRRHPGHFAAERRRALALGGVVPLAALALAAGGGGGLAALALLPWALAVAATARWLRAEGLSPWQALRGSALILASRPANLVGMAMFWRRHLSGATRTLIEYK